MISKDLIDAPSSRLNPAHKRFPVTFNALWHKLLRGFRLLQPPQSGLQLLQFSSMSLYALCFILFLIIDLTEGPAQQV